MLTIWQTGSAKITSVDVVPCDEGEPCEFPKGETAHVTIKGVANDDIQEAKLDTTLSVLGLQVPVPGVERDFCKIVSEPGCPIMAGQPFVADFDIPVSSIIPVTKTTLTVKVTGQAGVAVCLKVPVILK